MKLDVQPEESPPPEECRPPLGNRAANRSRGFWGAEFAIPPGLLVVPGNIRAVRRLRRLVSDRFRAFGARDCAEAMEMAIRLRPEVVLADAAQLKSGLIGFCASLRLRPETRDLPILVVTGRRERERGMTALSAGASDLLARPFCGPELVLRLNRLVKARECEKSLLGAVEQMREAESRLLATTRLAALGMVAGSVVHELAQPTVRALQAVRELRRFVPGPDEVQRAEFESQVTALEEDLGLARSIVNDVGSFARSASRPNQWISLADTLQQTLRLMRGELKADVDIQLRIDSGQLIFAHRNKLIQVLINLLKNAVEALRESPPSERPAIWISGEERDGQSRVSIRDNGPGIAPEALSEIFQPCYTTKPNGLGLGLEISRQLIVDMGGDISVRSEPGHFCEFTLTFPIPVKART